MTYLKRIFRNLEELQTLDGYNLMTDPIEITITPNQKVNTQSFVNGSGDIKTTTQQVLTGLTGTVKPKKNSSGEYIEDTTIAELGTPNVSQGIVPVTVRNA